MRCSSASHLHSMSTFCVAPLACAFFLAHVKNSACAFSRLSGVIDLNTFMMT